jgi:hypothetical protein
VGGESQVSGNSWRVLTPHPRARFLKSHANDLLTDGTTKSTRMYSRKGRTRTAAVT